MLQKLRSLASQARSDLALAPLLRACRQLLSERGQASVYALSQQVLSQYADLPPGQRTAFFAALATEFAPDPAEVLAAATRFAASPTAGSLAELTRAVEPPRQELLRRINRAPGGTAALLAMRCHLLDATKANPELAAVDADFLHLLASWFNPGFLRLERVDWQSSAVLLEKIIRHEAVHEITGWDDLRRRLQPDRRCYAFFHPTLGDEPLIFVEVALLDDIPTAIAPLIETPPAQQLPASARTAVFYSISNCQPGLRGVSLGNFLIKKVAEQLGSELPQLRTFCTLSPVPGFSRWLTGPAVRELDPEWREPLARVLEWRQAHGEVKASDLEQMPEPLQQDLSGLCARYLVRHSHGPCADPVARFHLDNGARLERVNFAADLSRKGLRQSVGLMVNYLYDLSNVEKRHQQFVDGEVSHAPGVRRLLRAR
ncbi:malonyl-CoA decarboxylase [Ramlibacter sp. AW1]|uniref:Malonyl-CoA decarboxylase n=1 Tax=Ramlibacter aurantiacus TaxID=2801330 RepID=A0A936ZCA6_9BURK|nr:malonyl-CoA decarboxylase [Ramlibacter aurantiacus]MBL0418959.1 malonyl-CoA decarboxylase [Ramlibacter aurantiacus]